MNVSLIVPVYNTAPYISECLASIMEQTFGGSMKCILVDDCGTDDSMTIVEEMTADYKGHIQFTIIRHKRNRGLSASRNTGIAEAKGDWLFFLDSDDTITRDCIESLYSAAMQLPGCIMSQGRTDTIPACAPNPFYQKFKQKAALTNDELRKCFFERRYASESAWNNLVKRQFLVDNSLYFMEGRLAEDQLWMFFMMKHADKVTFVNEVTYHYRRRDKSVSDVTD